MSSATLGLKSQAEGWRGMDTHERDRAYDAALAEVVALQGTSVVHPSRTLIAERLGISRTTLYSYLADRNSRQMAGGA